MATTVSQIIAVNPATEDLIASFDAFGPDEVEMALAEAHDAYLEWRGRPIAERAVPMRALARLLRERAEPYARLATLEMGKPIGEAKAEIEKCAWACEYFAENAPRYLADEVIPSNARRSLVAFQPLGVVLAVMPWNFPFWQVVRFAAPALMAGNAGLLKHASNVPQCALAIEEAIRDAGFPQGLLRTVLVSGGAIEPIIADDEILHALCETPFEIARDRLDDDEALGRDAGLAVVLIARADAGRGRSLDVRVREDDERVRSTELEDGLLDLAPRPLGDPAARMLAAGQRDRGDPRVRDQAADGR